MTTGIFLYNPQEGDCCFTRKEYAECFEQSRFLFVAPYTDEDCDDAEELPTGQFEEYLRIAEDEAWYQVEAKFIIISADNELCSVGDEGSFNASGDDGILSVEDEDFFVFLYALKPIGSDISEMLDDMLDELDD